ncbi:MAG: S8 family serine peptidase, partial [Asticcacaulis sp.]
NRRALLTAGLVGTGGMILSGCDDSLQSFSKGLIDGLNEKTISRSEHAVALAPVIGKDWASTKLSGRSVRIGVIDTGFGDVLVRDTTKHIRLLALQGFTNGTMVDLYADPEQHGTDMVEAIIGRKDETVIGLAPRAVMLLAKGEDAQTERQSDEQNVIKALEWLISSKVDILSISLGFSQFEDQSPYGPKDLNGQTSAISKALTAALAADPRLVAVVSAGNEGRSDWGRITFPGDVAEALTVGSVQRDLKTRRPSSGKGPESGPIKPDLCLATGKGASSMATALTAGLVACLREAFPDATRAQLLDALRDSGTQAKAPTREIGYGVPQAPLAIAALEAMGLKRLIPTPRDGKIG